MVSRRAVTRTVAVSSGAFIAGAIGMGTAAAAVPAGPVTGSGSGSLPSLVSTAAGTVAAATTGTATVAPTGHATTQAAKRTRDSGTALPKPVGKLVGEVSKDVTKTAATVQRVVDGAVGQLTGNPPNGGTAKNKPHRQGGTAGGSATHHRSGGSHAAGAAGAGRAGTDRHHAHTHAAPVPAIGLDRLNQYGVGTPGAIPSLPAGHAPAVAQAPARHPAVAAQPQHGLGYDLVHPAAMIPRLRHDTTLQLELLIVAGALAGAVAGGHVLHARRRLQTIRIASASSTGHDAAERGASEPVVRPSLARRPGHALG